MSDKKQAHGRQVYCIQCGEQSPSMSQIALNLFFNHGRQGGWMTGWVASTEHRGAYILCPKHADLLPEYDKAQTEYNIALDAIDEKVKERESG